LVLMRRALRLGVFGGTQGVGKEGAVPSESREFRPSNSSLSCCRPVIKQALEEGHEVTVLARDPSKLADIPAPKPPASLKIVQGDVLKDQEKVQEVISEQDVVVVSLGTSLSGDASNAKVCSEGQAKINDAMKAAGTKRMVVVTSIGVGDSMKDTSYAAWFFINTFLRKAIADKNIQEDHVKSSGLDYTIIRPSGLKDLPRSGGKYKWAEHIYGSSISRADVAELVLQVAKSPEHIGKTYSVVGA